MPTQVAKVDFGEVRIFYQRVNVLDWEAFLKDGVTPLAITPTDQIRCVISKTFGGAPILDLRQVANANGSVVTISTRDPAVGTLVLSSLDVVSPAFANGGRYACEFMLVDDSDTLPQDGNKTFMVGYLNVHPTSGNPVTIP